MKSALAAVKIFRNKYIFTITAFVVFMLFIDHNDLFVQWERKDELQKLQAEREFYSQKIKDTQKELADLQNNAAALEKYAREKYFLKRDNEDVFVLENPASSVPSRK